MALSRVVVGLTIFVVALVTIVPFTQAQEFAPAPAPTSDGMFYYSHFFNHTDKIS